MGGGVRVQRHPPALYPQERGARWRSWLRHYATNRDVAGSIPDGVMVSCTRSISWGVKAAGA
jgi:hypothetical protein